MDLVYHPPGIMPVKVEKSLEQMDRFVTKFLPRNVFSWLSMLMVTSPLLMCFSTCCLKLPLLVYLELHTEHTYTPTSGSKPDRGLVG